MFPQSVCKHLLAEKQIVALTGSTRFMSKTSCKKIATLAKKKGESIPPLDLTDLTNPCQMRRAEKRTKTSDGSTPSMWERLPKKADAPQRMLRYDEIHCKPSDKNRLYQQTWKECSEEIIRMKKVCPRSLEPIPIKYEKRTFAARANTSRPCERKPVTKCPKITMRGCRPVAAKVGCRIQPGPRDCLKIQPPYPSFSECLREKPTLIRTECNCWKDVSLCDVNNVMRRLKIRDLH